MRDAAVGGTALGGAVGVGCEASMGVDDALGTGVDLGVPRAPSMSVWTGVGGGPVVSAGTLELHAAMERSSRSPRNPTTMASWTRRTAGS